MALQITDLERQTYTVARAIAKMTIERFQPLPAGYRKVWGVDHRGNDPYWSQGQTTAGLILLFNAGVPVRLLTPWGTWCFVGGHGGAHDHMRQLGVQVLEELRYRNVEGRVLEGHGVSGPAFAIVRCGVASLPQASLRRRSRYLPSAEAQAMWRQLTHDYYRGR